MCELSSQDNFNGAEQYQDGQWPAEVTSTYRYGQLDTLVISDDHGNVQEFTRDRWNGMVAMAEITEAIRKAED